MRKDYLTEEMLREFVLERFTDCKPIFNKRFSKEHNFRPDVIIPEKKLVLEFNGPRHYTTSSIIIKDQEKTKILEKLGYKVIEIPYFVQFSKEVVEKYFSGYISNTSEFNSYPQGFISSKVILPADFCELGVVRFTEDMGFLENITSYGDISIMHEIMHSLFQWQDRKSRLEIYPKTWLELSGYSEIYTGNHWVGDFLNSMS